MDRLKKPGKKIKNISARKMTSMGGNQEPTAAEKKYSGEKRDAKNFLSIVFKKISANKVVAFWSALGLLLVIVFGGFFWVTSIAKNLPSVEAIQNIAVSQSTKIYDRTGKVLLYDINSGQNRTIVPLDQIPQYLKDATITAEDENFYQEPAFDWLAILRAVFVNLTHGQILQGGSTITQQLAKNAFLSPVRTLGRKIRELVLAIQLNRHYTKDQILGMYLNEIPYGSNLYGAEAASQAYFGKDVGDLDLAEATVLASLPRAPTYYSPWGNHQQELFQRQQYILKRMQQLGKITDRQLQKALSEKISFMSPLEQNIKAPDFIFSVEDYLTQKYGEDMVRTGGLKVVTTLDWILQQAAEESVKNGVQRNEQLYQGENGALVAEDPKTGQILSLVGSRDYFATSSVPENCTPGVDCKFDPKFDVATQGLRQPGSSLKPFVYMTAMEKGYTPNTVIFDVPTEFSANNPACPSQVDLQNSDPQCFHPQNFENDFIGPVSFRDALAQSINVPAVKVLYLAGVQNSLQTIHNFGVTTLNEPDKYGLSLVLGGGAVKLIDMVKAYSTLSQDGFERPQTMILNIQDGSGNDLESYQDSGQQVVDPQYPRLINNILSDAQARAPLYGQSLNLTEVPGYDIALKTGTSNDYRDAWTFGYTPTLVVGVWSGNNDNSPMQKNGSSILAAVPMWHDFMSQALQIENVPMETFTRPSYTTPPEKPILRGDYLAGNQIHSILYYTDKNDPTGPVPANPADDPQFANWEYSVLDWAKNNLPGFSSYNQLNSSSTTQNYQTQNISVNIENPANGSYINGALNIAAEIKSLNEIKDIKIYFNNQLVRDFGGNFGKDYNLTWSFDPSYVQPQNLLEIKAIATDNSNGQSQTIIYSQ